MLDSIPNKAEARVNAGKLAASRLTPEQRSARSTIAGNATLQRFGLGYYSFLGKLSSQRKRERQALAIQGN